MLIRHHTVDGDLDDLLPLAGGAVDRSAENDVVALYLVGEILPLYYPADDRLYRSIRKIEGDYLLGIHIPRLEYE